MAEKKHVLKSKGITKKGQGKPQGKSWDADNYDRKQPTMADNGPGSSYAMARLREEAQRVKEERKIPGNLGYRMNLGTREKDAGSAISKDRKMLVDKKKK